MDLREPLVVLPDASVTFHLHEALAGSFAIFFATVQNVQDVPMRLKAIARERAEARKTCSIRALPRGLPKTALLIEYI